MLTREEAGKKVVPFGKYRGLTLEEVSSLPNGMQDLSTMLGERSVGLPFKNAITDFMTPTREEDQAEFDEVMDDVYADDPWFRNLEQEVINEPYKPLTKETLEKIREFREKLPLNFYSNR